MKQSLGIGFWRSFRTNPAQTLFFLGVLCTLLVAPRDPLLMVSDSGRRFKSASWLMGGPDPGGPLPGVGGVSHYWFAIGQSLLFVPWDLALSKLGFSNLETRYVITSWILYPLINGSVLFLAWHCLKELGFKERSRTAGTLLVLGTTTLLFHFQNNQENPLMMACALVAIIGLFRWNRSGSHFWLNLACAAQAESALLRVTNLSYVLPLFGLPLLSCWFDHSKPRDWNAEIKKNARIFVVATPWMVAAFAIDRWWQWIRFGTWNGTYMTIMQEWSKSNFEGLPAGFPFSTPFMEGFVNQLISPGYGVFIYEPLLIATAAFWLLPKTVSSPQSKALVLAGTIATLGSAVGIARYYCWSSEPNWGDRYLATTAFLVQLPIGAWLAANLAEKSVAKIIIKPIILLLFFVQASGLWWPAYTESLTTLHKMDSNYIEYVRDCSNRGLPLVVPDGHKDFRFIQRPIAIALDLHRQWTIPQDQWLAEKPPLRMIWVTSPLTSLNPLVRWAVRIAWLSGVAIVIWLGCQALRGSKTTNEDRHRESKPV
jgi:hypothetical protein